MPKNLRRGAIDYYKGRVQDAMTRRDDEMTDAEYLEALRELRDELNIEVDDLERSG